MKNIFLFILLISLSFCSSKFEEKDSHKKVLTGADILLSEKLDFINNKRVGLTVNHSSFLSNGEHLIDALLAEKINVVALFGPEHGIRGKVQAGEKINDGKDDKTGIQVYSLYGKNRKPSPEILSNLDVMIFDIQDIGARFYTYISTMYYVMEACAENGVKLIILDRPNPIGGNYVNGPVLDKKFKSFVGIAEIPIAHGMTVGELAKFFKGERLFNSAGKLDLEIIKCENWNRRMRFSDTGLKWINPSPNINSFHTAIAYPGMCLLEATNVSEGRGTDSPFLIFGSPYIESNILIKELELAELEGVKLHPITFTPKSIPGVANHPKYEGIKCNGIKIEITDINLFDPLIFAINLIYELKHTYPEQFEINENWMAKLYGSKQLYFMLEENKTPLEIINSWEEKLNEFKSITEKYLLYN